MKYIMHKKRRLTGLLLIGLLLVLTAFNWNDLQILYRQQKFSKLMNTEYVSNTYHMEVTERYLIPSQACGTFYGIEEGSHREKYIIFYFQRQNGKSAIYEVYADDGISKAKATEILEFNQKKYDILVLDTFGFFLGTRTHDIRDFLYWRASLIDTPTNSFFIEFKTGRLLTGEEEIYE